jgi:hypothetical protein
MTSQCRSRCRHPRYAHQNAIGPFKVFKHLADWFEEFRLYHRKDGRVHKEGDDLMSATRYALMMLRHARTAAAFRSFTRRLTHEDYPPFASGHNASFVFVS